MSIRTFTDLPLISGFTPLHGRVPKAAREAVAKGLHEIGFVAVPSHHSIEALIPEAHRVARAFAELSRRTKKRYDGRFCNCQRGLTPAGTEQAAGSDQKDHKERYFIGSPKVPAYLARNYRDLYPQNIWPDADVPGFKEAMLALYDPMLHYGFAAMTALEPYFEVPDGSFRNRCEGGINILAAVMYNFAKGLPTDRVWAGAHRDLNAITIHPVTAANRQGNGLWLMTRDGQRVYGRFPANCLVLQVGNIVEYLSAGHFYSAVHGVDKPENGTDFRIALPFFLSLRADVVLEPMGRFAAAKEAAKYPPMTVAAYMAKTLYAIRLAAKKRKCKAA